MSCFSCSTQEVCQSSLVAKPPPEIRKHPPRLALPRSAAKWRGQAPGNTSQVLVHTLLVRIQLYIALICRTTQAYLFAAMRAVCSLWIPQTPCNLLPCVHCRTLCIGLFKINFLTAIACFSGIDQRTSWTACITCSAILGKTGQSVPSTQQRSYGCADACHCPDAVGV
jgi:hypothetical protein